MPWLAAAALLAAAGIVLTQSPRGGEQGGGGLQSAVGQSGGGLETASPLAGAREAGARSAVRENREHGKVQLWEGGPYWAETNIGADKPEDSGLYFWWGDTMGYRREGDAWVASDGSSRNFSFGEECMPTLGKSVATLQSTGWVVSKDGTTVPAPTVSMAKLYSWLKGVLSEYGTTVLAPEHDAAYVHWGGDWRMPTGEELSGLSSKCDWTWTTRNRVEGYLVRGRGAFAGASIFLPAAGYGYGTSINSAGSRGRYWSSVPYESNSRRAWNLRFDSGYRYTYDGYRYYGQSVRPVQGFAE